MLAEWVIWQPAHEGQPFHLEWARTVDLARAAWLLQAHRNVWPGTVFAVGVVLW